MNIERIRGSHNADTLIGDAGNNNLDGRAGDDTLIGGEGDNPDAVVLAMTHWRVARVRIF